MQYGLPFYLIRWVTCWYDGIETKRGIHLRLWRIGAALSWDGKGKYGTRDFPRQLTWNYGLIRWTVFWCSEYDLYIGM
jgi:hypothetical protein